jgi:hypothetical protein
VLLGSWAAERTCVLLSGRYPEEIKIYIDLSVTFEAVLRIYLPVLCAGGKMQSHIHRSSSDSGDEVKLSSNPVFANPKESARDEKQQENRGTPLHVETDPYQGGKMKRPVCVSSSSDRQEVSRVNSKAKSVVSLSRKALNPVSSAISFHVAYCPVELRKL